MRSFVSFLGGAISTGLVVGILALAGVIDDDTAPTAQPLAPPTPTTQPVQKRAPSSGRESVSDLYKRVSPGVVFVQSGQSATGSGFVYDSPGHIVTNDHVVEGANSFSVRIGNEQKP